jgi:hypothetical protein
MTVSNPEIFNRLTCVRLSIALSRFFQPARFYCGHARIEARPAAESSYMRGNYRGRRPLSRMTTGLGESPKTGGHSAVDVGNTTAERKTLYIMLILPAEYL